MKKIINNPDDFVKESINGLVNSYPDIYNFSSETEKVEKIPPFVVKSVRSKDCNQL